MKTDRKDYPIEHVHSQNGQEITIERLVKAAKINGPAIN